MHTTTLRSPWIKTRPASDSRRFGKEAIVKTSTSPDHDNDRLRLSAYVLVALVALFTGYVLGLIGGQPSSGSRVGWPPPPTNPRSFNP